VASLGDTGDLLDVQLRKGAAHTAEGALDFILPLLDRVEKKLAAHLPSEGTDGTEK